MPSWELHRNSLLTVTAPTPIFFTDNNGGSMLASDPYTDNGVEQIILCPSDPTQAVHVEFIVFDLQTNSNPNNQDLS